MSVTNDGYLPTPDEIEAACLAIQSNWTEAEKRRRRHARFQAPHYDPNCERNARLAIDGKLAEKREAVRQAKR